MKFSFLAIAACALISAGCGLHVKADVDLGKKTLAEMESLKTGLANSGQTLQKISDGVRSQFQKTDADKSASFARPAAAPDYSINIYLDSRDDQMVLANAGDDSSFASIDFDDLTLTEDGQTFNMVDDQSNSTLLDWWFESDLGEIRRVYLDAGSNQNRIEGVIEIYGLGGN